MKATDEIEFETLVEDYRSDIQTRIEEEHHAGTAALFAKMLGAVVHYRAISIEKERTIQVLIGQLPFKIDPPKPPAAR